METNRQNCMETRLTVTIPYSEYRYLVEFRHQMELKEMEDRVNAAIDAREEMRKQLQEAEAKLKAIMHPFDSKRGAADA